MFPVVYLPEQRAPKNSSRETQKVFGLGEYWLGDEKGDIANLKTRPTDRNGWKSPVACPRGRPITFAAPTMTSRSDDRSTAGR